jgi:hypothetical protein
MAGEGWTFIELQSSHVPMADEPEKLLWVLQEAAL